MFGAQERLASLVKVLAEMLGGGGMPGGHPEAVCSLGMSSWRARLLNQIKRYNELVDATKRPPVELGQSLGPEIPGTQVREASRPSRRLEAVAEVYCGVGVAEHASAHTEAHESWEKDVQYTRLDYEFHPKDPAAQITPTAIEPISGWSDNLYGPLGILLSSHCGILRVIRGDYNLKSHTVPGDMCINALLCFAWDLDRKWKSGKISPPVMNFSAKNTKLLIPMKQYIKLGMIDYAPFKKAIWYQMLFMIKNKYVYDFMKFLLHTIPAYLIDAMLIISLRKPRMKKIYSQVDKTSNVLQYFLLREWGIDNDNVKELWSKLSTEDRIVFNFDIDSIDIENYFRNMAICLKKFILKEDITKLELHRKRHDRLKILHYTLKYSLTGLAMYSIFRAVTRVSNRYKK
nr:fatty acyl-CoA reductase wat-like [Leptinotarsa decemlineata]